MSDIPVGANFEASIASISQLETKRTVTIALPPSSLNPASNFSPQCHSDFQQPAIDNELSFNTRHLRIPSSQIEVLFLYSVFEKLLGALINRQRRLTRTNETIPTSASVICLPLHPTTVAFIQVLHLPQPLTPQTNHILTLFVATFHFVFMRWRIITFLTYPLSFKHLSSEV